jgi:DNA invertase Pin-like site-specific DNA recombinase/peptidoglycan hydrolase-like protein with peptidoglycan-binding domain
MQAITGALSARVRPAVLLLAATIALALALAESAAASTAYRAESAQPRPIPWTGWSGQPIQRPRKPVEEALLSKAAFPAGWSAGAVRYGTGYHRLGASERVREVQRRLTRLGYHTGPVDGLYGPLTRSAVQWFQIKHGLRPTGVVAAATLVALRDPTAFTQKPDAQAKEPAAPSRQPFTSTPAKERHPAPREGDGVPAWLVPALLATLAAALSIAAVMLSRPAVKLARARRTQPSVRLPALGYATVQEDEQAIRQACRTSGWTLANLVRDEEEAHARPLGRPGLRYALEQLTDGAASRLVVHRLEQIAGSVAELGMVLGWFMRTGIALTALDVGLDTGTAEGKKAVRALLAIIKVERQRTAAQTSKGLAAAKAAHRPAVADSPELASRIRRMRAGGMTLQAIADTLNSEGVPTVRGGAEWRPSSVQSVLGYRRARTPGW